MLLRPIPHGWTASRMRDGWIFAPSQTMPLLEVAGRPTMIVVHLFSGRRRHGDVHCHLRQWACDRGHSRMILSLDTAICWQYGDLHRESDNWHFLQQAYEAGIIAGTICGPPCETFSEARFQAVEELGARAPRPLRSSTRWLGLEGLTTKELYQVKQGSALVLQT